MKLNNTKNNDNNDNKLPSPPSFFPQQAPSSYLKPRQ